mmetsp:Transcript_85372/g.240192  ORF Transcript_85372/g.240192 Transcript_85372/m.240192 type:complete len:86 (+) Transcript_85372:75-332(+)
MPPHIPTKANFKKVLIHGGGSRKSDLRGASPTTGPPAVKPKPDLGSPAGREPSGDVNAGGSDGAPGEEPDAKPLLKCQAGVWQVL